MLWIGILSLMYALFITVYIHCKLAMARQRLTDTENQHNELNEALISEGINQSPKSADTLVDEIEQDLTTSQSTNFRFC
mgnify:FL=1